MRSQKPLAKSAAEQVRTHELKRRELDAKLESLADRAREQLGAELDDVAAPESEADAAAELYHR